MMGAQERSLQIDIEELVPHGFLVVVNPHVGTGIDAGTADEDIETAEFTLDEPHQGSDAVR